MAKPPAKTPGKSPGKTPAKTPGKAVSQPGVSARQAKIDAARKANKVGPNKIMIGSVVAVVAIIAVVAGVIINSQASKSAVSQGGKALPAGVTAMGRGWVENASVVKAGAPTVSIYEDFRCPICQSVEQAFGSSIQSLAEAGKIKLVYHFKTVIDSHDGSDNSQQAASNVLCAADAGVFWKYHDQLYANQPPEPGTFSNAQFTTFAKDSGLSGAKLTAFQSCATAGKYLNYVKSTDDASYKNGITGTPAIFLNGVPMNYSSFATADQQPDPAAFEKAVLSGKLTAAQTDQTLVKAKAKDVS